MPCVFFPLKTVCFTIMYTTILKTMQFTYLYTHIHMYIWICVYIYGCIHVSIFHWIQVMDTFGYLGTRHLHVLVTQLVLLIEFLSRIFSHDSNTTLFLTMCMCRGNLGSHKDSDAWYFAIYSVIKYNQCQCQCQCQWNKC